MVSGHLFLALLVLTNGETFVPISVDFAGLRDEAGLEKTDNILRRALSNDGPVAITNIPDFARLRTEVLQGAHSCIVAAPRSQSLDFPDGTTRRTLAAVSTSNGLEAIDHGSSTPACKNWERTSEAFRHVVADAINLFTKRLGNILDFPSGVQLLKSSTGDSYDNLEAVVNAGERLEHFHTYAVPSSPASNGDEPLIDYHIDQGLFIAFVPATLVDDATGLVQKSLPTGTFMIKSKTGVELKVDFDGDSLVVLLGDDFNQYLTNRHRGLVLHAPAHAFRMPRGLHAGMHRVWYGMMQLPPQDAMSDKTGLTFGEVRANIISNPQAPSGLGCSRQLAARELSATCSANQMYCWHRCMNFTASVSPTACAAKHTGFNCTSQFDQVYRKQDGHGDFNLACTNSTQTVTPRPVVVQPAGTCNGWQDLISDTKYAHRVALAENETYFLWNVAGDQVEGRMVHKGLVGWMAIGLANIGGKHNGMNGARIVMGQNDPAASPSIGEHKIHESLSAFRHWKTPLSPSSLEDASMVLTGCFSSIKFKTKKIYGQDLNVTHGINHMIWGLTHAAYTTSDFGGYAAYHSAADGDRMERTRFRGLIQLDFNNNHTTTPAPAESVLSKAASGIVKVGSLVSLFMMPGMFT
eukprot:TRINITY_DN43685_c0_g1_i1.p1 TRINITY_DN43685_c0_g1~~TRINITY_DN43685_c0_g1_i1.p1  ORF type:complete len:636 (+),score=74.50 TRINITY_DN43685_c0_g1_i1:87-1994(+)